MLQPPIYSPYRGTRGSWSCTLAGKGCWKPRQVQREAQPEVASSSLGVSSSGPRGYVSCVAGWGSNGQQEKSPLIPPEESGLRNLNHRQVIPSGGTPELAGRLSDYPPRQKWGGPLLEKLHSGIRISKGNIQGPFQPLQLAPTRLLGPALLFSQSLREAEPGLPAPKDNGLRNPKMLVPLTPSPGLFNARPQGLP